MIKEISLIVYVNMMCNNSWNMNLIMTLILETAKKIHKVMLEFFISRSVCVRS